MIKINKVSPSLEDYLEAIYFLHVEKGAVRVTDVAISLDISKPSVNKAITNLKNMGYVDHEKYGLLKLTESGTSMAKSVARRHYIIKYFLIKVLEIDDETAEKEACKIEHQMSATTVEKLALFLEKNKLLSV